MSCAVWSLRHMRSNDGKTTVLTSSDFHDSRCQHFHSLRQEQLASTDAAMVCTLAPKHAGLWYIFYLYLMSDWLTDWMADGHIGRTLWEIIKKRCDSLQAYWVTEFDTHRRDRTITCGLLFLFSCGSLFIFPQMCWVEPVFMDSMSGGVVHKMSWNKWAFEVFWEQQTLSRLDIMSQSSGSITHSSISATET